MEKCAATAIPLLCCSDLMPAMSAEDCTAHRDSFVSQSGVVKRAFEDLVRVKEINDDGCHGAKKTTVSVRPLHLSQCLT